MSAKQEPAQAPSTVSQGEASGGPPPGTTQGPSFQHHVSQTGHAHQAPPQVQGQYHQGQVMYQPQPYGAVHFAQPQTLPQGQRHWNQPPQGTVHYMPYPPHQEVGNFSDKVPSYNHYGTVHFAQPIENGDMMMRGPQGPHFVPHQYITSPQWYPPGQPHPPGQFVPTYATNFNVATDPNYHPNHPMNRGQQSQQQQPQQQQQQHQQQQRRADNFEAPIGAMESQAHASASYTANWVSTTSSLPPEMIEEPESDNISQYDGHRPSSQMNGDNWTERDEHFSPSTAHHHSQQPLPHSSSTTTNVRHHQGVSLNEKTEKSNTHHENKKITGSKTGTKNSKGDRNEEKRELTFDERLEKARMQKDRVENDRKNAEAGQHSGAGASAGNQQSPSSTAPITSRSNGGLKIRQDGGSNSQAQHQNNNSSQSNARVGRNNYNNGQHKWNNSTNVIVGEHQNLQASRQERGDGEQSRQPRRDYNYSNQYENNYHNQAYNQNQQARPQPPHSQPSQPQHHQNTFQSSPIYQQREGGEFYRQSSYRGGRGGRGGSYPFNRGGHPHNVGPTPYPSFGMPPQVIDHSLLLNAFQNLNSIPPAMQRLPLLPGPFGMPRMPVIQQDVKFRNTWLDASSCPLPLAAVMNIDTRFSRGGGGISQSYTGGPGRGRGGYGYRGRYRGPQINAQVKTEVEAKNAEVAAQEGSSANTGEKKKSPEKKKQDKKEKTPETTKDDMKQEIPADPVSEKPETETEEKPKAVEKLEIPEEEVK
uniref:Uncharacterized protein n=1 Tax=Caenorhabditis japonica TaxID=281687 RepID=A0A8R1HJ48_CAEJA